MKRMTLHHPRAEMHGWPSLKDGASPWTAPTRSLEIILGAVILLILLLVASTLWTAHKSAVLADEPYALKCAVRNGQVLLTWKVGGDPAFTPQAYRIFRAFSPGGAPILVQTVAVPEGLPGSKTMSVTDKPPYSTTWNYEIQAFRTKPDASGPYIRSAGVVF